MQGGHLWAAAAAAAVNVGRLAATAANIKG
jgi:hypothetical protein